MTKDDIAEVVAAFASLQPDVLLTPGSTSSNSTRPTGTCSIRSCPRCRTSVSDEYGGDLAGRSRLLHEVNAAVRAEVGEDVPVFVRISASEWTEGGFDISEAAEVSRSAVRSRRRPHRRLVRAAIYPVRIPIGPGYQVSLAAAIRAEGVPTGAVGLITDPEQAETILSTGQADAIFMARAALREPSWPQRAAHVLGAEPGPYPPQYTRGAW
jgi:2,4-dienoyl-CoA reductase-like NADH-dependent reductase (Old Yellow Enzyme family)